MERSLSALIAVRNAESTLRGEVLQFLDILPELTSRFELVVVDDCSSDATIEVADELAAVYPQLLAVRHATPRGRGAALATGLDRSVGQIVFFADADCRLALDPVRQLWDVLGTHELALACPSARDAFLESSSRPAYYGGGYQMGTRRAFRELTYVLGDQEALIRELQRRNTPWHRVTIEGMVVRRQRQPLAARSGARDTASAMGDRSIRTDPPGVDPTRSKYPSHAAKLQRLAAES